MRTVAKVACRLKLLILPSGSAFPRKEPKALGVVSALTGMLCPHRSRLLIRCTSPLGRRPIRRSQIRSREVTGNAICLPRCRPDDD